MARRWAAGWTKRVAGLNFRVVPGKKGPGDLRMEWRVAGEWQAIPMAAAAILTDFFCENEDELYPPPAQGADYFLSYLHTAATGGWEAADVRLQLEKRQKRAVEVQTPTEPTTTSAGWTREEDDDSFDDLMALF